MNGSDLKRWREEHGLIQWDMSVLLDVPLRTYQSWEVKDQPIDRRTLRALADINEKGGVGYQTDAVGNQDFTKALGIVFFQKGRKAIVYLDYDLAELLEGDFKSDPARFCRRHENKIIEAVNSNLTFIRDPKAMIIELTERDFNFEMGAEENLSEALNALEKMHNHFWHLAKEQGLIATRAVLEARRVLHKHGRGTPE